MALQSRPQSVQFGIAISHDGFSSDLNLMRPFSGMVTDSKSLTVTPTSWLAFAKACGGVTYLTKARNTSRRVSKGTVMGRLLSKPRRGEMYAI